jgi:hypothetical protein
LKFLPTKLMATEANLFANRFWPRMPGWRGSRAWVAVMPLGISAKQVMPTSANQWGSARKPSTSGRGLKQSPVACWVIQPRAPLVSLQAMLAIECAFRSGFISWQIPCVRSLAPRSDSTHTLSSNWFLDAALKDFKASGSWLTGSFGKSSCGLWAGAAATLFKASKTDFDCIKSFLAQLQLTKALSSLVCQTL